MGRKCHKFSLKLNYDLRLLTPYTSVKLSIHVVLPSCLLTVHVHDNFEVNLTLIKPLM